MTTATKSATPAKRTATKSASAAPTFDFSDLTPEAAQAPTRTVATSVKNNPAIQWLRDSWAGRGAVNTSGIAYGKGQQIPIPHNEEAYKQASTLIRQAAKVLSRETGQKIGVAITTWDAVKPHPDGKRVYVAFAAKTAKTVVRKPKTNTPAK